jgi:hypothetical protein
MVDFERIVCVIRLSNKNELSYAEQVERLDYSSVIRHENHNKMPI